MNKYIIFVMAILLWGHSNAQTLSCQPNDAICNTAYTPERNAVVQIELAGSNIGLFTGFLVNNAKFNGRWLVLTTSLPFDCRAGGLGNIAVNTQLTAQQIKFSWNFDVTGCNTGTFSSAVLTGGAKLIVKEGHFAVLELNNPPGIPNPVFLGWDISSSLIADHPNSGVNCIYNDFLETGRNHEHPKPIIGAGGYKLVGLNTFCQDQFRFSETFGGEPFFRVDNWTKGQPSMHARGAPLFLQGSNKVIGMYVISKEGWGQCAKDSSYFVALYNAGTNLSDLLGMNTNNTLTTAFVNHCLIDQSLTLTGNFAASRPYVVQTTINSTQSISTGYTVSYTAGTEITLNDGFVSGTDFVASIQTPSCTTAYTAIAKHDPNDIEYIGNNTELNTKPIISVYPTMLDAANTIAIKSSATDRNTYYVSLYDINGKAILSNQQLVLTDVPTYITAPYNLSSGMYLLNIVDDEYDAKTFKIIKP